MTAPGWWSRNWKWLVPVGCLTTLLLFAGFLALVLSLAFGMLKGSDPYTQALAQARAHPAVIDALGTPISDGFFPSGNIEETGAGGSANFAIPISGPKGDATLYLEARKAVGRWTLIQLEVEFADGRRLDLLEAGARPVEPSDSPQAVRA